MSLKKVAINGFIWNIAQQLGGQIIGFIISVILARLILPEEFGLIGMLAIFMGVGSTIISSGLIQSLIRTERATDIDYSTVFYFNLFVGSVLYVILFFTSPFIASFFNQPALSLIIKIYCSIFIIQSFGVVQMSRLTIKMDFKTQLFINLPSLIIGGVLGVVMAYLDYGVWSLVWSSVIQAFAANLQVWFWSKWRPKLKFDKAIFLKHWKYGYKLLISGLINTIFSNIYSLIIGKYFLSSQVGYYQRANNLKQLPVNNISTALNRVTFPLFAKIQNENDRLRDIYRRIMQVVVFLVAPTLIIMAVLGEPLFTFLFTEKWLPAVPYFQILCINGIVYPINAYNLNILTVKGLTSLFLKLEIMKKLTLIVLLIIGFSFGVYGLLFASVLNSMISLFINGYFSGKYISYTIRLQLIDLFPTIVVSTLTGFVVYMIDALLLEAMSNFLRLIIGGSIGGSLYFTICYTFKFNALKEINLIMKGR